MPPELLKERSLPHEGTVTVVGAGIAGLATARALKTQAPEGRIFRNLRVKIVASEFPPDTNSNRAGAFFYPRSVSENAKGLVGSLLKDSLDAYRELEAVPDSGVRQIRTARVDNQGPGVPWWINGLDIDYRRLTASEKVPGYNRGYSYQGVLIEAGPHLNFLMRDFLDHGGEKEEGTVGNIDDLLTKSDLVIDCSGLGTIELTGDNSLYPVRGQMVKVDRTPDDPPRDGSERVVFNNTQGRVHIPRSTDDLYGGTGNKGDWGTDPRITDNETIFTRMRDLVQGFKRPKDYDVLVGLRPTRDEGMVLETVGRRYSVKGLASYGFTVMPGVAKKVLDFVYDHLEGKEPIPSPLP